jgi:hypothetical protein
MSAWYHANKPGSGKSRMLAELQGDPESSTPAQRKPWFLRTNGSFPECDLRAVANSDFSRLAPPLYVAARDQEQLEDFTFREGLMCSEVRRFLGARARLEALPENKILILLPRWQDHPTTRELVEWWVEDLDRYTVELPTPKPLLRKPICWSCIAAASFAGWCVLAFFAWLIFR